ncbi:alkaline phosphatase PhoX [Methylomonas methanica]|uniref:PEP motif putative anchor domain protein n=1 Tax=Methylomonas methanica (strain DSM 25384 / MC09) TaxID=857087 RepID=G0A5D1_METMM|nr:alkaline phosphatase PhoX [Methylomonas methanica]AEG01637.1 PEP motif putative anchor domain protein [Methylomonas methanica MC09]
MKLFKLTLVAAAISAVVSPFTAQAADTEFDNFTPMTGDTTPLNPGSATPYKLSSPYFSQQTIADRATQNALVPGSNSGNFDMITANETGPDAGRYLFMPFETSQAGVQRIDLWDSNYNTRTTTIVAPGTQGFVSGDASRWTPWGGYLTAEERWGTGSTKGRLFEISNPTTATANGANFVQETIIPRVSHEGLAFDSNNALYFVDELNGGSIYKYVSADPFASSGADYFAAGQTFALKVGNGGQFEGNNGAAITGSASWEAITDADGSALVGISAVLGDGTIDGRVTADTVTATGYNRPEDLEIQTLSSGDQFLYFATTDSDDNGINSDGRGRVYSFNLTTLEVKLFADSNTIDAATGLAAGGAFSNPDNLAIDSEGNIYIVEDQPGGIEDVWFAMDSDRDGVAESISKWISLTTDGAESTGLYFDKFDSNKAYINVQHPFDGIDRTIELTATAPVPVPGAAWLFGSAILGGLGVTRRKRA